MTEVVNCLVAADVSPPSSFASIRRKLEVSRSQWKVKAAARRAELEKDRIKKRDLTGSRDKWRTEALDLRKTSATAEKKTSSLKQELDDAKKNS